MKMSKLRLVIDTNVFISALLFKQSLPFQIVRFAFEENVILISDFTFAEIKKVLLRKKFDKYLSSEERHIFLAKLSTASENIIISENFNLCRDPKDNCFLDLAMNGYANFIITGDNDLLVLNPFNNIEIITPQLFSSRFLNT
jgi:uncharacterized protein